MNELTNGKLAYMKKYKNFKVEAWWGDESEARIIFFKDGEIYHKFNYPSYRIWNIAAHFQEIVDSELAKEVYR